MFLTTVTLCLSGASIHILLCLDPALREYRALTQNESILSTTLHNASYPGVQRGLAKAFSQRGVSAFTGFVGSNTCTCTGACAAQGDMNSVRRRKVTGTFAGMVGVHYPLCACKECTCIYMLLFCCLLHISTVQHTRDSPMYSPRTM